MRRLCGTVLIMEAVVVLLAIVPTIRLEHVSGSTAGAVGGLIAVVAIVLSGLVGRPRMGWALYAGTVLQFGVIASGVLVPAMYVLGVIFALLWFTGIWLARKVEREQRAREAAASEQRASNTV
jgi:Sec-independent protein secretion pathway component TatC